MIEAGIQTTIVIFLLPMCSSLRQCTVNPSIQSSRERFYLLWPLAAGALVRGHLHVLCGTGEFRAVFPVC